MSKSQPSASVENAKARQGLSLKEQIEAAEDLQTKEVPVDEWGLTVEVRSPTVRERTAFVRVMATLDEDDRSPIYPALLAATCFDPETGERVFADAADAEFLLDKNGAAVDRVAGVAMRLAGLTPGAVETGKDDSEETPT